MQSKWSSGWAIDLQCIEKCCERSGCVFLIILFQDICRVQLTITTKIQRIAGAQPWNLTQHALYTDLDITITPACSMRASDCGQLCNNGFFICNKLTTRLVRHMKSRLTRSKI